MVSDVNLHSYSAEGAMGRARKALDAAGSLAEWRADPAAVATCDWGLIERTGAWQGGAG